MKTLRLASTLAVVASTSAVGSAVAADWQALGGVAATPLTAAQMETVEGKQTLSSILGGLPGGSVTASVGASTITLWSDTPGQQVSFSGNVNASEPVAIGPLTLTYNQLR